jgi:transposase
MTRRRGRPTDTIELSTEERECLERYTRRKTASQQLVQRSRIVLLCADGLNNRQIAAEVGLGESSVGKWRKRFNKDRLDGLHDTPRPGAPRKINDDKVEEVIVKTLETTPKGATHWSTRFFL